MVDVVIFDGDHRHLVTIKYAPPQILMGGRLFDRVDDPETGEPLGCYTRASR